MDIGADIDVGIHRNSDVNIDADIDTHVDAHTNTRYTCTEVYISIYTYTNLLTYIP